MDNETIVLDVGLDALIEQMQKLQVQYTEVTQKMKDLAKAGQMDTKEYGELIKKNAELRYSMGQVSRAMNQMVKEEKTAADSLDGMRLKLNKLRRAYDALPESQRQVVGAERLAEIQKLNAEISKMEQATGRYQRNVGNYKSALEGLSLSFREAGLNARGLDKVTNTLNRSMSSSNPLIAAIAAAIGLRVKLFKAHLDIIKKNEEASNRLNKSLAGLKPITDAFHRSLNAVANGLSIVFSKAVDLATKALGAFYTVNQKIINLFGGDSHMGDNFKAASEAAKQLEKDTQNLAKRQKEWELQEAKIQNQAAAIRKQGREEEAHALEEQIHAERAAMAAEEVRIAKLKDGMQQTAESAENLRQALIKQAQEDANAVNLLKNSTKEEKEEIKQVREALEEIQMMSMDEYIEARIKKNKELADSIQKVADKVGALKTETQGLAETSLKATEVGDGSGQKAPSWLEKLAADYQNAADIIEGTTAEVSSSFGSLSSIYDEISKDETRSAEEREEAAKRSKTWAKMQIAANAAVAVAKGTAAAMDMPFPANLPALASVLAAVLSAIAQAKALAGEGGTSTPTMSIASTGNSGAAVTPTQQQQLTNAVNTSTTSGTANLAGMLSNMPAPVLVYSEFTKFANSVNYATDKAKLQ